MALFVLVRRAPARPAYVYLGTLPFLAGIDRDVLVPLVRPNEALLALLLAGAAVGGYLRFVRGDAVRLRFGPLDVPLFVFVVLSTVWPLVLAAAARPGARTARSWPRCCRSASCRAARPGPHRGAHRRSS